jgi:DNA-binding transcriptional LysR family regulator
MNGTPKITLDQWRALLAVVDADGYAQAAEVLHKSQSAVTYAVQKLESVLGVKVFEVIGRKAHLTPTGEVLYRRAKSLLEEAGSLEDAAGTLAAGWEPELRLAVDIIFPTWLLLECFERFADGHRQTRVELYETVLSGTEEMLLQRKVDLAICSRVPPGFAGDALIRMRFIAAAHPDHPLHRLGRELTLQDLRKHRHLVIRDSGSQRRSGSWVGAEQIWTVSHKATSIHAACMGLGFAWFPEDTIRIELERGLLKPLPLREGAERSAELYLVFADRDYAGPGALRLAQIIREQVQSTCRKVHETAARAQAAETEVTPATDG